MTKIVAPRILVLEGLYADTAEIVTDCGGIGIEASPWNMDEVRDKIAQGIDGVLLTGGTDVNPKRYGEKPCPVTQTPDYVRDYVELEVLKYARDAKIPVLGICRGSQIMCVSQGGRLTQDIQLYTDAWFSHTSTQHDVEAADGAVTFRQACAGDGMHVISLHHQCVAYPGQGMRIAALSIDGTPEAIESKDGLMLGVQFHPEMNAYSDPQCFAIFQWLVNTAARRMGGKAKASNFHDAAEDYYERVGAAWRAYQADNGQAAFDAWADDYEGTSSGTSAANPGGPAKKEGKHRQAGDPAIPSMRAPTTSEMVRLIENSTGQSVTVTDGNGNVIDGTCEECEDHDDTYDCAMACQAYPMDTPRFDEDEFNNDDRYAALALSLRICPTCHIMFDCIEDCDDHKKYVHPENPPILLPQRAKTWGERFAEMNEPPPGDPAWEDLDEEVLRIAQDEGYEPVEWIDRMDQIH